MAEPVSEDVARTRWMVIQAVRVSSVAMVLLGIVTLRKVIALPDLAGYALLAVGLPGVFLAPRLLARKWRSPSQ